VLAFERNMIFFLLTFIVVVAAFSITSSLPANTTPQDVAIIIIFSILASTIAGLIPAWRAAKLKPVEALRSE
jgi:lipoprotein-releasing system permease protein